MSYRIIRRKVLTGLSYSVIAISLAVSGVLVSCTPEPAPPPPTPQPEPETGTLENCIEASSFEDYYQKSEFNIEYDAEWMSEWITPVPITVRKNLTDIEIYSIPIEQMGADMSFTSVIKSGNLYCELTDSNAEKIFAPVGKEEAIDYLILRLVTLGTSTGAISQSTILTEADYDRIVEDPGYMCERTVPESERRITTLEETEGGFLVTWVYYTPFGYRAGYYEDKLKIGHDGRIEFLEEVERPLEPFIDCGQGFIM
jgi:hypothetical protein